MGNEERKPIPPYEPGFPWQEIQPGDVYFFGKSAGEDPVFEELGVITSRNSHGMWYTNGEEPRERFAAYVDAESNGFLVERSAGGTPETFNSIVGRDEARISEDALSKLPAARSIASSIMKRYAEIRSREEKRRAKRSA